MNILIIAVHFPPANSTAALRPRAWAEFFSRHGHEVSVLTTASPERDDKPQSRGAGNVELIRVPAPGSRFFRSFDDLSKKAADQPQGQIGSSWLRARIRGWLYYLRRKRGLVNSARMPDHYDLWVLPALWRVRKRRWDIVISTYGPYACHFIGYFLRRSGSTARWIADFRDLWVDNHIFPGLPPFTWIERHLERRFCGAADRITTVSQSLAETLDRKYPGKITVLENGVDLGDFAALSATPIFPDDGVTRLVYTGTVYEKGQNPEVLFAAIARTLATPGFNGAALRVLFAGKFQARIADLIRSYECGSCVVQCGQVSREDSMRMQRDADGLIFLSHSPHHEGILTGKLFEYLASGTEIFSLGDGHDASTGKLIDASARGRDYGDDVNALADAIRRLIADKERAKFVNLETRRRIDRERSNRQLMGMIEQCMDVAGNKVT